MTATPAPRLEKQRRAWMLPAVVAVVSFALVVSAIDPGGSYPNAPGGPGTVLDESFNVEQGVYQFAVIREFGLALLHPDTVAEVYGAPGYLPDHPPLGRLWIGLCHELTWAIFPPTNQTTRFSVVCARTAPAMAFALTVFLVGMFATLWYGRTGGLVAALSVVLMPRLFGHAHFAALETFIGLTYTATVLSVAHFWTKTPRRKTKRFLLTGCVFGLALLSKIQAILLPIPIALWVVWHWRLRACIPLLIWGTTGLLTFVIFWPWLWLDPFANLGEYLLTTSQRTEIFTWYFGHRFADHAVPWHYPAIMFLSTVPIGLHGLGMTGLFSRNQPAWKQRREQVVLLCIAFPLIIFSLPGVVVYDGVRLFLVVFPLWALMIGRGGVCAVSWLKERLSKRSTALVFSLLMVSQAYGLLAFSPCYLSYYNMGVGGLWGAEKLGFDVTYWSDSITRDFLNEAVKHLPPNAIVAVAPVLHPSQLEVMLSQSPILRDRGIQLRPFEVPLPGTTEYLIVFRRQADLVEQTDLMNHLGQSPPQTRLLAEVRRQNVQLAALYAIKR